MTAPEAAVETRIVSHHVGGRDFSVSFTPPERFAGDLVNVLYEADGECAERMNREKRLDVACLGESYVLPYALGRQHGIAKLNLTYNAYASSLLPPDECFYRYYSERQIGPLLYDEDYGEMLSVIRTVEVEVHALDDLIAQQKLPKNTTPDFLSLDVQGAELEVLNGARDVIRRSVVGIISEVEILPVYKDQPLLGDLLAFMNEHFHFAGLTELCHASPYRCPIGLRGKAFPAYGDAVFLRKIDSLSGLGLDPSSLFLKFAKLAFVSIVLGYVEYGLAALASAQQIKSNVTPEVLRALSERRFWHFLHEVETAARAVPPVFLPRRGTPTSDRAAEVAHRPLSWAERYENVVAERYGHSMMQERHLIPGASRLLWESYRMAFPQRFWHLLLRRPDKAFAKLLYYVRLRRQKAASTTQHEQLPRSPFEALLIDNGFEELASIVAGRRIAAERLMRCLDQEMRSAGYCQPAAFGATETGLPVWTKAQ